MGPVEKLSREDVLGKGEALDGPQPGMAELSGASSTPMHFQEPSDVML